MVSDTYMPSLGGAEYHVISMLREMRERGEEVTFFTTEEGVHSEDDSLCVYRKKYAGIASILPIAAVLWRLSADVEIVHAHYSYRLAFIAGFIARLRRKPFVITQHGLGLLPQVGASFFLDIVFRTWRYWSMRWSKTIISTSQDLSIDICSLGFSKKIVHIPNGYDEKYFAPLPTAIGTRRVLAVRRHVPKNGIQYLIASFPAVLETFPNARLLLVGDGRLHTQLRALTEKLNIQKAVDFLGSMPHEKLLPLYETAEVVVIPSTAESTSLVCIEAMAMARSIVASKVGGLIELLGENIRGYLVPITDSEHCDYHAPFTIEPQKIARLSDAIIHVFSHPEEAVNKAKSASEYAKKHYTWSVIADRTLSEVYYPLVQNGTHKAA